MQGVWCSMTKQFCSGRWALSSGGSYHTRNVIGLAEHSKHRVLQDFGMCMQGIRTKQEMVGSKIQSSIVMDLERAQDTQSMGSSWMRSEKPLTPKISTIIFSEFCCSLQLWQIALGIQTYSRWDLKKDGGWGWIVSKMCAGIVSARVKGTNDGNAMPRLVVANDAFQRMTRRLAVQQSLGITTSI